MKVRQMDGDVIRWMERYLFERMVEIIIEGNTMERHPVEAAVPQGSPVSPILFAIYKSGLINWVEQYRSEAQGLPFLNDLRWVATGSNVNQVVTTLERWAARSNQWVSRQRVQFDTAKTEGALFTHHRKHLRPTLTAKI